MSQASKKIDWCLKKAEKELADSSIHRGLIKIEPNNDLAGKHIAKAQHNLEAAHHFAETGYSDWAPSAFFYSMYHCCVFLSRLLISLRAILNMMLHMIYHVYWDCQILNDIQNISQQTLIHHLKH